MAEIDRHSDQRIPPRKPAWNIWQGLFLVLLVTLIEYPLGWLETPNDLDSLRGILRFSGVGFGDVFLSLVVIWLFMRLIRRPSRDLGLVKPLKRFVFLGFIVGILLFLGIGFLGSILTNILGTPSPQSFTVAVNSANYIWEFALLVLLGGILAPIKEEIFFRSLLYPPLRKALGRGPGMFLAGILFAVIHFDIIRFLPLLIGGIVLAWLYERAESVWPSVIAHGTWNILMAVALWIQRF